MSIVIIAEIGVNHDGSLAKARKLVDIAVDCGADYAKFQYFTAERTATNFAPIAPYAAEMTASANQSEMLSSLELSWSDMVSLREYCDRRGIGFASTAFDVIGVQEIASLRPDFMKIPSGEITNLPMLRAVGASKIPVLLSSGASTLDEVSNAIQALEYSGMSRSHCTVLHCTSCYPTEMTEVNLLAMTTMRDSLGVEVGYSDHTTGTLAAICAAALGAQVMEKHITFDSGGRGPDHASSMEPADFHSYVQAIRNVEMVLGNPVKAPSPCEMPMRGIIRKSIVASKSIKQGEIFTEKNITTKRPGIGASPMTWDSIVGKRAKRSYAMDELIEE